MRLVYIAGPYRAKTIAGIRANIERARRYAEKYWSLGYAALCPHLNSAFMDGLVPDEQFLAAGLRMLKGCDAVVMIPGWEESSGSRAELNEAEGMGMEVIFEV